MGEEAKGKSLDDQITEMIGMGPVSDDPIEEVVVDEVEEEVEDEPIEEPADVEEPQEPGEPKEIEEEEGVAKEGEVEDEEEEVAEEGADVEEEEETVVDEAVEYRDRINKIAEAALKQGVKLPADLLGIEEGESTVETPAAQPQAPAPTPQPVPQGYDTFEVLTEGMDFDDFLDNPESFAKGMRDILARHEQMLSQKFMGSVPTIVSTQVRQVAALQDAVKTFYKSNEDLLPVRPTVGAVADQLAEKHPDWSLEKVMNESAAVTRKLLRMPSPEVAKKKGRKVVRPSFAKGSKSSQRNKPKPKMSKLQQEIDELL